MDIITSLLIKRPYRSSELVKALIQSENISYDAARKRLSRARAPIKRLDNIKLPNNELIFYYDEQFGRSKFISIVSDILKQTNSAAGRALVGLETAKGALPVSLFAKSSGTAIGKHASKHTHAMTVMEQLTDLNIAHIVQNSSNKEIICIHGMDDIPSSQQATFLVEDIVLSIVQRWLANLGIGSFDKIEIREQNPTFSVFSWDIVGPSYVTGLVRYKNGTLQNGFVVGDIILNRNITLERLKPFLYKIDSLNHQKNIRPFLALFIADYFESDALKELRRRGVIIASPKTILGQENADLLKSLIKIIDNATAFISEKPDELFDMMKKLNKIEGAALNLRSVVLDFILARIYSIQGYMCDIRSKIQTSQGDRAEIDVVANRPESIVCIEGKAVAPGNNVHKEEVKNWINKSYPRIKKWLNESGNNNKTMRMEFYSSTGFDEDALTLIDEFKIKHKKIEVQFLGSSDIIASLKKFRQKSLIEIFKEQFV